jgi:hypothetical protein
MATMFCNKKNLKDEDLEDEDLLTYTNHHNNNTRQRKPSWKENGKHEAGRTCESDESESWMEREKNTQKKKKQKQKTKNKTQVGGGEGRDGGMLQN